jgi:hypothetical protein
MSFPEFLKSFGLEVPTAAYLAGLLVFGIAGAVAWRHGRKAGRPAPKWLGVALMFFPYATPQTWLLYLVGTALCVWLFFAWD